jgi:hypothetical protein
MARAGSLAFATGALLVCTACSHRNAESPRPDAHVTPAAPAHDARTTTDAATADAAPVVPAGPSGTIEGSVFLDGPIRRGPAIQVPSAWQNHPGCRDAALRYAWPFDTTTPGPFAGALVAAEAHTSAPVHPVDRVMTFRDCDIVPRALFAREGDRILFHPDTRQNHLPHITGSGASIDQVLIPGQADQEKRLPGPGRYPVTVRNLPEFVGGLLFVLPNRFIDTSDTQGHFRITDVPVGNVVVHAWYPGAVEARNVVAVRANETAQVEFHLHQAPSETPNPPSRGDAGPVPP